jgi:hypothetical protein
MPNIRVIPRYVEAKTKEDLSRAMLAYQMKRSGVVRVISISQDLTSKKWVCWFYDEAEKLGAK